MTQKFDGFPKHNGKSTPLPGAFFSDLLPLVDDLAELKVTLFCFWALYQKEGRFRYLRYRDFSGDDTLKRGLLACAPGVEPEITLEAALVKACERGTILHAEIETERGQDRLYFVNTALGRTAIEQLEAGEWKPGDSLNPVEILPVRPNIFTLYEENIGPLTPMIADALKDAERDYPHHWIEEAMRLSVEGNVRNWRYVATILERWKSEGKSREVIQRSLQQTDGKSYITGPYADFIEH